MPSPADFFGIPAHNLIKSHLRDSSCHLDCGRASFYNDALLFVEARRSFKEREVDSEPLAQWVFEAILRGRTLVVALSEL